MDPQFDNSEARERLTQALARWTSLGEKVRELARDLTWQPKDSAVFPAATPGYSVHHP
jgi:hypothetical protein